MTKINDDTFISDPDPPKQWGASRLDVAFWLAMLFAALALYWIDHGHDILPWGSP